MVGTGGTVPVCEPSGDGELLGVKRGRLLELDCVSVSIIWPGRPGRASVK